MNFKGKVEDVTVREFAKKDGTKGSTTTIFVKEQVGDYPQAHSFEMGDKITTTVAKGDIVEIEFNLGVWETNDGKRFNQARAWKVTKTGSDF